MVLGLKINVHKSKLYPIYLLSEEIHDIKSLTSFKLITTSWRHLGVMVPTNLRDHYKSNFIALYKDIKQKLHNLSKQTFSWIERIDIVKTFITPKFLFLFRMLPLPVPASDLKLRQSMLNNFIWKNK